VPAYAAQQTNFVFKQKQHNETEAKLQQNVIRSESFLIKLNIQDSFIQSFTPTASKWNSNLLCVRFNSDSVLNI